MCCSDWCASTPPAGRTPPTSRPTGAAVETAEAPRDDIDGAIEACRRRREARAEIDVRRLTVLAAILGPRSRLIGLWGANGSTLPCGWFAFALLLLVLTLLGVGFARWPSRPGRRGAGEGDLPRRRGARL